MVTNNTVYDLYKMQEEKNANELYIEIERLSKLVESVKRYFIATKGMRPKSVNEEELLSGKHPLIEVETKYDKLFNIQLKTYNDSLIPLQQHCIARNNLKTDIIPKNIFIYILRRFNLLLLDAIIEESYTFKDKCLGVIRVALSKNRKSLIDWGKSGANKKRLLAEGKKLYYKSEAVIAENEGRPYTGEQWIEYLPEYSVFINWSYTRENAIKVPNIGEFIFVPVRGVNGAVAKLHNKYRELPYEELVETLKHTIQYRQC